MIAATIVIIRIEKTIQIVSTILEIKVSTPIQQLLLTTEGVVVAVSPVVILRRLVPKTLYPVYGGVRREVSTRNWQVTDLLLVPAGVIITLAMSEFRERTMLCTISSLVSYFVFSLGNA